MSQTPPIQALDNEYASLVYYPDKGMVHHTFHKTIGGAEFRAVLNTGIDLLNTYKGTKWLSDDRKNSALSPEDTAWSMNDWFPRALQAGWKCWALVVPEDIKARINLKEFVDDYYEKGLRIMVFTNAESALEWLDKVTVQEPSRPTG